MKMKEAKMNEKIDMTIRIGNEHIPLTVAFSKQEAVRETEKAVAELYNSLRAKWPSWSEAEILARVAYQFAYFYKERSSEMRLIQDSAEESDRLLGKIIESAAV